jgi:hypothetical protein
MIGLRTVKLWNTKRLPFLSLRHCAIWIVVHTGQGEESTVLFRRVEGKGMRMEYESASYGDLRRVRPVYTEGCRGW